MFLYLFFQESRQILIAEYQNIVTTELLPLLLGSAAAEKVKRKDDIL